MFAHNLLDTQELYQTVVNHLAEGICLLDREKNIWVWNEAAEKITGYSQEEMSEQSHLLHILDAIDSSPAFSLSCSEHPISATFQDGSEHVHTLFLTHKRGRRISITLKTIPVMENKEVVSVIAIFTENNAYRRPELSEQPLSAYRPGIDPLTGLPDKNYAESMLQTKLEKFRLYDVKFSVLFINLDDFSKCNAQYGYEIGNRMLVALTHTLRDTTRDTDFIVRLEGEEFVGIFETQSEAHLQALAEKICRLIEQTTVDCDGKAVRCTASIGATTPCSSDTPKRMIERANSLMHVSKISGKNCVTIG